MPGAPEPLPAPFVTMEWLASRLGDADVQVVDGSWYLPAQNRNAQAEFAEAHIPGAIFFDIDAISDASSGLPHMLPDAATFARDVGALGLRSDSTIVVYDGAGLFSAPRVWWTLRLFGARAVCILQGGMPAWTAAGLPLESGRSQAVPATFEARERPEAVADLAAVKAAMGNGTAQIVDARPAARFRGEAPEPRPGLRAGHMPGSRSLPASDLIADGTLKAPAALSQAFAKAGIDPTRPIIASCGSGVTAAVTVLALEVLGHRDVRLYDGSWSEYGGQADLPVETGAAG